MGSRVTRRSAHCLMPDTNSNRPPRVGSRTSIKSKSTRRQACAHGSDSKDASNAPMDSPGGCRSFGRRVPLLEWGRRAEKRARGIQRVAREPGKHASGGFRHSLRHQQFLRHLIACKSTGQLAALREMALGIDFFCRPASTYDPKTDAVVRIEAGRLRQRLDRYYHGEGIDAPFEISLDKGSYLPIFRMRAPAAVTIGAQPSVAVLPLPPATPASAHVEFAAPLTDEIVQTLSRLPQVRVLGPESSPTPDVASSHDEALNRLQVDLTCG